MCVLVSDGTASCLAEIDRVAHEPRNAELRPVFVAGRRVDLVVFEVAGEFRPRCAESSTTEDLGHGGSGARVDKQFLSLLVACVADRCAGGDVYAAFDGSADRGYPVLFDPL